MIVWCDRYWQELAPGTKRAGFPTPVRSIAAVVGRYLFIILNLIGCFSMLLCIPLWSCVLMLIYRHQATLPYQLAISNLVANLSWSALLGWHNLIYTHISPRVWCDDAPLLSQHFGCRVALLEKTSQTLGLRIILCLVYFFLLFFDKS